MIRYKTLAIFYIALQIQTIPAQSQWQGGNTNYGSYFVPYSQDGATTSGPIRYVPVQGYSSGNHAQYPTQSTVAPYYSDQYPSNGPYLTNGLYPPNGQYPPNEQYPPNGQYAPNRLSPSNSPYAPSGPYSSPIYSNTPTVSYQGLETANAVRSAYPNQPVIIINNGGNGDTGGNSNNGNSNGRGKGNGLDLGDLAAIFLATKHHRKGDIEGTSANLEESDTSVPLPPQAPRGGYGFFTNGFTNNTGANMCDGNNKCDGNKCSTHITIILPSSGGTITVGGKKKKKKSKTKKKEKKTRNEDDGEKEENDDENDEMSNESDSEDGD